MDATYNAGAADPVVGLQIFSVNVTTTPLAVRLTLLTVLGSGKTGEEIHITLAGARAAEWFQAWTQAAPKRKMIQNLIAGGELTGVTEV